jgi:putative sigma-54 modulation protein
MQLDLKTIHFALNEVQREHIERRLERFSYAREYLVDLGLTLTREGSQYHVDASLHFRWGSTTHLKVSGYELLEAFDRMIDKIQAKVSKEKEKMTRGSHGAPHRAASRG